MKRPNNISCAFASGLVIAVSLVLVASARAEKTTVVSPPALGLEDIDGDIVFIFREPYTVRPPIVPESTVRWQELHPASAFESLGPGPFQITQMAWRPDASVYEPISNEWEGFRLLLSTTDVGTLGDTFSENYGPRGATDVFSGTLVLQTDGATRGPGLPHDFDYVIEFESPFFYYPDEGDLLFDASFEVPTAYPWIWVDAELTGEYVAANPIGPVARNRDPGLFVTEFTVVTEPVLCDFNGDRLCNGSDIDRLMTDAATGATDTDLNGDGVVDDADRDEWLVLAGDKNGFSGPLFVGDSDLNGTVDAADLNALALSWREVDHKWTSGNFSVDGGPGVNAADLNALALNWRESVTLAGQAVPEPSTFGGMLLALTLVTAWRKRQTGS